MSFYTHGSGSLTLAIPGARLRFENGALLTEEVAKGPFKEVARRAFLDGIPTQSSV